MSQGRAGRPAAPDGAAGPALAQDAVRRAVRIAEAAVWRAADFWTRK